MVSTHLVDAIRNPSRVINYLYDRGRNAEVDFPAQVTSHFGTLFNTEDSVRQIPLLSLKYPPNVHPDGSLVRFHAMIQDIPPPEMYLSKLPGGVCGGWNLCQELTASNSIAVDFLDLREYSVFWAITVPGESQWYAQRLGGSAIVPKGTSGVSYPNIRRYKLPHPQTEGFGILVKIYDKNLTKDMKVMTIATFVGILVLESIEAETASEVLVLPVLHVTHLQVPPPDILFVPPGKPTTTIYEDLIDWVSQEALAGDNDAAELVILCSVARVQSRNPPILPPSLQLTSFPSKNMTKNPTICSVLSTLLPLFSSVNLSLEVLNNDRFVPESNGEDLSSGYLQIPAGSVMLLTESRIKEGNVTENGVRSLRDVQSAMNDQNLQYSFPFSRLSFDTDIRFILLTEGKRSPFFRSDITLPLQPQNNDITQLYKDYSEIQVPDRERLDAFRSLLYSARRKEKLRVTKELSELIERDFVEERKRDKSVTQHDLMTKVTIARLLGQLVQEDELSVRLWERAKELDARRKKRLQV